jgi:hypothetical protein
MVSQINDTEGGLLKLMGIFILKAVFVVKILDMAQKLGGK